MIKKPYNNHIYFAPFGRRFLQPTAGGVGNSDQADWMAAVTGYVHTLSASFNQLAMTEHTLKSWRLDDNIVIEKLVLSKPE